MVWIINIYYYVNKMGILNKELRELYEDNEINKHEYDKMLQSLRRYNEKKLKEKNQI